jgi:four helix bundle protein
MSRIKEYEEMEAWKESRVLANRIYDATNASLLAKDFGLRDQMRRAAISILSNIAEGFEGGGDKEFFQFLAQAKGSAGELRSQLYLALDRGYLLQLEFDELCRQVRKVSRMISGLMGYLRESKMRGSKYADKSDICSSPIKAN